MAENHTGLLVGLVVAGGLLYMASKGGTMLTSGGAARGTNVSYTPNGMSAGLLNASYSSPGGGGGAGGGNGLQNVNSSPSGASPSAASPDGNGGGGGLQNANYTTSSPSSAASTATSA